MGQFYYRPTSLIGSDQMIFSFGFKHSPCEDEEIEIARIHQFLEDNTQNPINYFIKNHNIFWEDETSRGLLMYLVPLYHDLKDPICQKENNEILESLEIKLQTEFNQEIIDVSLSDVFSSVADNFTYLYLIKSPSDFASFRVEKAITAYVPRHGEDGRKWISDLGRAALVGEQYLKD